MIVGYPRTLTVEQQEQASSVAERAQLKAALNFVRKGDVFVVTKIDRLGQSITNLMEIIGVLERKKVAVRILDPAMDTETPTGKLMLTLLGGIAEFERAIMLERQREGIAKAKGEGKYKGRKPHASETVENVLKLDRTGIDRASIAKQLGIGIASVSWILAKQKSEVAA